MGAWNEGAVDDCKKILEMYISQGLEEHTLLKKGTVLRLRTAKSLS